MYFSSSNLAGIQKWSPNSIINDKIGQTTGGIVDIGHLDEITAGLFAWGIILTFISVLSIASVAAANRSLSLVHWISITILANGHLFFVIIAMLKPDTINRTTQSNLNNTIVGFKTLF